VNTYQLKFFKFHTYDMLYIMQDGMIQSVVVDLRKKNKHADIFIQ